MHCALAELKVYRLLCIINTCAGSSVDSVGRMQRVRLHVEHTWDIMVTDGQLACVGKVMGLQVKRIIR